MALRPGSKIPDNVEGGGRAAVNEQAWPPRERELGTTIMQMRMMELGLGPVPPAGYPRLIGRQIGQRLVEVVGRGAHVLEIRGQHADLADDLMAAGARVIRVELATTDGPARRSEQTPPPPLRVAQESLPFATHSFDAALAVDVGPFVRGAALWAEVRRILHPGTPLILGLNWQDPSTIDARVRRRWLELAAQRMKPARDGRDWTGLLQDVTAAGGRPEPLKPLLQWSDQVSAASEIDRIVRQGGHDGYVLGDQALRESVEELNRWMFATAIDPNATDLALRELRVALVRWIDEDGGPAHA